MNDPRIGTRENLPAFTISGQERTPSNPLQGIGGDYVIALDVFPQPDADAVIAALCAAVAPPAEDVEADAE